MCVFWARLGGIALCLSSAVTQILGVGLCRFGWECACRGYPCLCFACECVYI